jgi:hypothetical protein
MIYDDITERDEGIDQLLIIRDHNYKSLIAILIDDHRDALMTRLHTPEQRVQLDENELLVQFQNNQTKLIPVEL